jgi:hypothetical protein
MNNKTRKIKKRKKNAQLETGMVAHSRVFLATQEIEIRKITVQGQPPLNKQTKSRWCTPMNMQV